MTFGGCNMFPVTNSVAGSIGAFLVYEIGIQCVSTSEASKMSSSVIGAVRFDLFQNCLLYTSPSPRDGLLSRMPSSA